MKKVLGGTDSELVCGYDSPLKFILPYGTAGKMAGK